MDMVLKEVQDYVEKYTTRDDALLDEIADYTLKNHPHAHMLSGHFQGQLLQMISSMIRPERILEIGTFTGYSALSLAKGLNNNGFLHTIEVRREDAERAKSYFDRSDFRDNIILHIGDALDIIGELTETWDLVFIDADKVNYINYFKLVLPQVKQNGYILADNVLFHGQVLEEQIKGKNALAIQEFNDFILQRDDLQKIMLPVRDGLYLVRKLN